jgi:mRNA-degrading endonuclease YafQ of YafQ-DinJ toxin-antitoxin module
MGLLVYKRFYEQEIAKGLTEVLAQNGIEFELTEDKESLDSLYGDKQFSKQYFVKIKGDDFRKVDSILHNLSEKELETVDKDHYLYGFTDEELFEIVSKPDEWNEFDFQLSKKILKERGKEINQDTIDLLKKQRLNELAKPEEGQRNWIYAGYLFALLGGLIGVFIGWHLSTYRKTLPNGQQVYGYKQSDRVHGRRIRIIGIIMFIITLTIRFSNLD